MILKECKRLAEVDFPIAEVSQHVARDLPAIRGLASPGQEPIRDPVRRKLNVAETKRARRAGLDPSSLANLWMETLEEPTTDLPLIT
jgi:hypothetical protein